MLEMNVCRVCLGDNVDLYGVTNTNYRELFEKLTSTKLEDGLPESLCYICHSQLRKCMKFVKIALKSYKLLLQWSRCETVMTKSTLSAIKSPYKFDSTPVEVLSIDSETPITEEVDVKQEVNDTKEVADKPIKTNASLYNYHSLFLNDKSNDTPVPDETPSLLRHLLISNDKALNDKVSNDNSVNNRVTYDILLNKRVSNDNSLNETPISNDNSSLLRNLLVSNDKSTNDTINNDYSLNDTLNTNEKSLIENDLIFLNDKSINYNVSNFDIRYSKNDYEHHLENHLNDDFSSSDDVFLSSFKPKIQTKGEFLKDQYKKFNVTEVKLDIEQQRQDFASRLQSDNYKNSDYKCDYCYKGFTAPNTFAKHMYKHSEEKSGKYECDICHYRYRIVSKLRIHIENTHSRFYKCNICGSMLHSLFDAKIHNNEHEGIKYACKLCSKEFKKRTSYFSHVRMKHSSKHTCRICGKNFVSSTGLLQHVAKIHRDEITRQESGMDCYDCDLNFVSLEALYRHRLDSPRHKAAWQHSTICYVCHHDLKNKILLKKHLKEHRNKLFYNYKKENGVKEVTLWKCDECLKVFTLKGNLRMHIKRQHMNIKLKDYAKGFLEDFICEICGHKLKSKASLMAHRRSHTGERPHLCTTCPKRFSERWQLTLHSRIHSGHRPYHCDQCSKRFTQKTALNRHMRIHTGARPYTCQLCLKQFTQNNTLKNHVATVHFKLPTYKQKKHLEAKREKEKIIEKNNCEIREINDLD